MRQNKCVLVFVLVFGVVVSAEAEVIKQVFQEGAVDVRCEPGKAIEVVVAQGVSSLVRSGDPGSLKVEHVAGHLFITPLARSAAELMVIDAVGRSYRLKFVFDHGLDEKVVIAPRVQQGSSGRESVSTIDLVRELAAGRVPVGAVETLREAVILENERVRIKTALMYEMQDVIGYVLTAENLLSQSQVVPVEQFNVPGLLAVTSQKDILSPAGTPGDKGIIYMVTSR